MLLSTGPNITTYSHGRHLPSIRARLLLKRNMVQNLQGRFSFLDPPMLSSTTIPSLCSLFQQNLTTPQSKKNKNLCLYSTFLLQLSLELSPHRLQATVSALKTVLIKVPNNLDVAKSYGQSISYIYLILRQHSTLFPPSENTCHFYHRSKAPPSFS